MYNLLVPHLNSTALAEDASNRMMWSSFLRGSLTAAAIILLFLLLLLCGRGTSDQCRHSMGLEAGSNQKLLFTVTLSWHSNHGDRLTEVVSFVMFFNGVHVQLYTCRMVHWSLHWPGLTREYKTWCLNPLVTPLQSPLAFGSVGTCPVYLPTTDTQQTATVRRPYPSTLTTALLGLLFLLVWYSQCQAKNFPSKVRRQKKNIATGETSQAITPYHFFNYSNFFGFYH